MWWNSNNKFFEYERSIDLLNKIIYKKLNLIPQIIWWPSINGQDLDSKDVIVNTKESKVILFKWYNNIKSNIIFTKDNINSIICNLNKI